MNPVTRHLLDRVRDPDLAAFALAWDSLEEQIVSIYRAGECSGEAGHQFERLREACASLHPRWAASLEPHWRAVVEDEDPLAGDPFRGALTVRSGEEIVGHRRLLRTLPAAREALNGLLLERSID